MWHGGLIVIVSALVSGSSCPGSSLAGIITLSSWARHLPLTHSASLHPVVQVGTGEHNTGGNPATDYM